MSSYVFKDDLSLISGVKYATANYRIVILSIILSVFQKSTSVKVLPQMSAICMRSAAMLHRALIHASVRLGFLIHQPIRQLLLAETALVSRN